MPLVCLQAGHENARKNCIDALKGSTGAPGEVEFTVRIRNRLSDILNAKGIQTQLVDGTYNCDPKSDDTDYDLFMAIHYDADIYGTGGGFFDVPDPTTDGAAAESKRIMGELESEYFNHSGIVNKPQRRNANTKYYYMWRQLSLKTPCSIIECGVGKDAHDTVILADTDRVANAIARGICKAFGVEFDAEPPEPPEDPVKPSLSPSLSPSPSSSRSPSNSPSPEIPPDLPPPSTPDLRLVINRVTVILYGRGWWWTKIKKLKAFLPKK